MVPKAKVEAEVDWRMPVFEAGRYLVAFDGAALLLLELWRREDGNRSDYTKSGGNDDESL